LYEDCALFQCDSNISTGWQLISATKNIVCNDKISPPNPETSASSAETVEFFDVMHSHELDVYSGQC